MPRLRDLTPEQRDVLSPYLLSHLDNPVDWWTWSDDAFEQARRRDVPVLVSIGYASCHWCHVMARESFSDPRVAATINEQFVAIKVDREERPDVDSMYMAALQAFTGCGGWPLNAFVDHDRLPFHAATYLPPVVTAASPSFGDVLAGITRAWRERRQEVRRVAEQVHQGLEQNRLGTVGAAPARIVAARDSLHPSLQAAVTSAVDTLAHDYDAAHPGWGSEPKFPAGNVVMFLLHCAAITDDRRAPMMAFANLEAMSRGGIHDQIGGGFCRYSVDRAWTVPHFEKMIYDNVLLLRCYVQALRRTAWIRPALPGHADELRTDPAGAEFWRAAEGIVRFLLDDLRLAGGGFATAVDADSPPRPDEPSAEGAAYLWTAEQVSAVVTDPGDFAKVLQLCRLDGPPEVGLGGRVPQFQQSVDPQWWEGIRQQLLAARRQRPQPRVDDKVVAAWNGQAIAALVDASHVLGQPNLLQVAETTARYLLEVHVDADGVVWRVSRGGQRTGVAGLLEDYAGIIDGFVRLAGASGNYSWLDRAEQIADVMVREFTDPEGRFFDAPSQATDVPVRMSDPSDMAFPSGTALATTALLALGSYRPTPDRGRTIDCGLSYVSSFASHAPRFGGWHLVNAVVSIDGPTQVVLSPGADELEWLARWSPRPGQLTSRAPSGVTESLSNPGGQLFTDLPPVAAVPDVFVGRVSDEGDPRAYVCRHNECELPATTTEQLKAQLTHRQA